MIRKRGKKNMRAADGKGNMMKMAGLLLLSFMIMKRQLLIKAKQSMMKTVLK